MKRLIYMVDRNGCNLACSPFAGHFEQFGISNIEVLKSVYGVTRKKYRVGQSLVSFKMSDV